MRSARRGSLAGSPLNVGSGTVKCQHGTLPVPAPATLALLGDAPVYAAGPPMERVTPTGAAVLRMLDVSTHRCRRCASRRRAMARAAAKRRASPTCCACWWARKKKPGTKPKPIAVIETVIDDSTPQVLAYVSELLLEAGAWDVYRAAVQMKKGRTGVQMTVLCGPISCPAARPSLPRNHHHRPALEARKQAGAEREFVEVSTEWGKVRIKIARWPSGKLPMRRRSMRTAANWPRCTRFR
jgi:uncharacterized protein (DUF111 family)